MSQSEFVSERLGFRPLLDSDFDDLKRLDTDPEVRAHFPDGVSSPDQVSERIARNRDSFARNGFGEFAVIDRETGRFAGRAGFSQMDGGEIEVGYVFQKEYWGKGLAQETVRALLTWAGQNLGVDRILAYAPTGHDASLNVMKKCRMRYLKTCSMHGTDCDFYEYSLRRTDGPDVLDRQTAPEPDAPPLFQHPQWMVGVVLVLAMAAVIAGLGNPVWLLIGSPFILVLAIYTWVRFRS